MTRNQSYQEHWGEGIANAKVPTQEGAWKEKEGQGGSGEGMGS